MDENSKSKYEERIRQVMKFVYFPVRNTRFSDHQFGSTAATTPHSRLTERKLCNGILIRTLTIGRLKPGVVELKDWQMSDCLNNNICQHSADFVYHMVTLRYCFVVHTIMTIMYGLIQPHWKTYSVWIYLHILMYTYTHLCLMYVHTYCTPSQYFLYPWKGR